ncbi:cytoplasmic 60S subunit biogenesis factor ZNF622 [Rhipicephalus microplus]|uniref:cytoplasmic 60S subunit biogenesis factor ZNF622 n=1 Tax=Rhipicephalus microplus TaxID=6941 RepID=UPI003F6ABE32
MSYQKQKTRDNMASVSSCACLSCKVVFANAELHRSHYKSDWHRYNLKRKVAFLPPVSAEEFQQRVLAHREASVAAETCAAGTYCDVCGKRFGTPKAFENHVNSKKHQQALVMAQSGNPEESGATSSCEVIARPKPERSESTSSCSSMVARKNAKNASEHAPLSHQKAPAQRMPFTNRTAMAAIVDEEDSGDEEWQSVDDEEEENDEEEEDEEGMEDDSEQVLPTECLFCGEQSGSVVENVAHMGRAHSFFIPDAEYLVDVEGLLTYLGYKLGVGRLCLWCSNERSAPFVSVQAARQHMRDKGHCKMAHDGVDGLMDYSDFYDYTASYPEGEGGSADEEVDVNVLDGDGWQLVLPSGAVAGHRALARYYRQNLPAVAASRSGDSASRVLSHYRALGWTGATSRDVAQRKARDIRFIQSVRAKKHMKLGVKANKLQTHFRQQVMF